MRRFGLNNMFSIIFDNFYFSSRNNITYHSSGSLPLKTEAHIIMLSYLKKYIFLNFLDKYFKVLV